MPESIYLPPFSINQWLRIVISKRQNSSGTLIPLCSTDQHISLVKFADILASTFDAWQQQPHQLRKKSDKNEETRPGNIRPSYESDRERNCMAREQNNLAQWLDFTFLIPKDSKFPLVVEGSSGACGKTWLMSFFVYWKFHRYMNTRAAWNANIEESICDQKPIQFLLNEASVIVQNLLPPR